MLVPFALCRNNKILIVSEHYEDLEYFVEEFKKINPKTIDRREYKIISGNETIIEWKRK